MQTENRLAYQVGGLLYASLAGQDLAARLGAGSCPGLTSVAFCLEDAIRQEALPQVEAKLKQTLASIRQLELPRPQMPLFFVRVRTPQHLRHIHEYLGELTGLLTGYILPKFDLTNAEAYLGLARQIAANQTLYIMPILESRQVADLAGRAAALTALKELLDKYADLVLNVRVGGNDFCNLYGLRRSINQNIYSIGVVRDILTDIVNVFGGDYVISGPVWEYFGKDKQGAWAKGLRQELALDRLNGFIGKTAIHPAQLPLIYQSLKVSQADWQDAQSILSWSSQVMGVAKSADGSRMNELECHRNWARRIKILGEIYGINE